MFFASPGRVQKVSGHGEGVKRYQIQIDGSEVTCHDEIVSVRAKNKAPARGPASPRRLSPGRRTCLGAQKLING